MRQEFTYNQIAHLNAPLHEQRLPYRISFHDAERSEEHTSELQSR